MQCGRIGAPYLTALVDVCVDKRNLNLLGCVSKEVLFIIRWEKYHFLSKRLHLAHKRSEIHEWSRRCRPDIESVQVRRLLFPSNASYALHFVNWQKKILPVYSRVRGDIFLFPFLINKLITSLLFKIWVYRSVPFIVPICSSSAAPASAIFSRKKTPARYNALNAVNS